MYNVEASIRANKHRTYNKGDRRGNTKQWGTETGDLWKGEGWSGEHGVKKMDTTGTFGKESREFEGGGFGVDERG